MVRVILKVGHHGSKTSSSEQFIDHLRPELAIISAGRKNMYGHPHSQVIDTFSKFNIACTMKLQKMVRLW